MNKKLELSYKIVKDFNVRDNMENKKLRLLKYHVMLESNITLTVIIKYVSLGIIACIE